MNRPNDTPAEEPPNDQDLPSLEQLNRDRLEYWGRALTEKNASALIVIGVVHGDNEGALQVCVPKGADAAYLYQVLGAAQRDLPTIMMLADQMGHQPPEGPPPNGHGS